MRNRIDRLKDGIMGKTPYICPERARYWTNSWKQTEGEPIQIRRALAFQHVLEYQTVFITPGELIVGNQAGGRLGTPIFPEYGGEWLLQEIDTLPQRKLDKYGIADEVVKELKEMISREFIL